jgi:hypothetical protein
MMPQPLYRSDHARLTDAGWAYRTNGDRGWVMYRDPATRMWLTREEAMRVMASCSPAGRLNQESPPFAGAGASDAVGYQSTCGSVPSIA